MSDHPISDHPISDHPGSDQHDYMQSINEGSLYQYIGITLRRLGGGEAESELRPAPELCWPFEGQPHGGILFTQMDTTMAYAVVSGVEGRSCATINLDIQFTARAKAGPYRCLAWLTHHTGRTAFARAETRSAADELLAMGQGSFRLIDSTRG